MPEGPGMALMRAILKCSQDGNRAIIDERIMDTTVHTFIRRVAMNPVTGSAAVAIAVLGVIKDKEDAGMDYAHIAKALSANYTYLYYVNMETEEFVEYRPDPQREDLSLERHGGDFFAQSRKDALQALYKDDQKAFIEAFTKENMEQILDTQGTYTLTYRLLINDVPTYVNMKAVRMRGDRKHIIIGVSNVDAQMRQQEALTRMKADLDKLTGVRNRTAYESMSETLTRQIEDGQPVKYAIVMCRVNDLAQVNEEKGREAGDQMIREACAVICETFKHSPVFRVTGDQFAAIAQGHDYEHIDELMTEMEERERESRENDGVIITCGMARYDGAESVAAVFQRAEAQCG
jgi:diguanylate cyclase (GGDEF)-like protein